MKLTDRTCACNGLTNFECEARKLCEFTKTSMEKLVKSPWANLCFDGFLTFETTVRQQQQTQLKLGSLKQRDLLGISVHYG